MADEPESPAAMSPGTAHAIADGGGNPLFAGDPSDAFEEEVSKLLRIPTSPTIVC